MRSSFYLGYCIEPLEPRTLLSAQLVADLDPRTIGSNTAEKLDLGNQALFWVNNDLWRTDGTPAGTSRVRAGFGTTSGNFWVAYHGEAYFFAKETSAATSRAFWRSDGTAAGTVKIADGMNGGAVKIINDVMYWGQIVPGNQGSQLWKSDGTAAGTTPLYSFNNFNSSPGGFTYFNGYIYFAADDGITGSELWRTDGTATGTARFVDIRPGGNGSAPGDFCVSDNHLYFAASNATSGLEPYISDGTPEGTVMLRELKSGLTSAFPSNFVAFNGAVYFLTVDGLYKTNGTSAGTVLLKSLSFMTNLTVFGNQLLFAASRSAEGTELWHSDGTQLGTDILKDVQPGTTGSIPQSFVLAGLKLYFTASDGTPGTGWWSTDGTTNGTVKVGTFNSVQFPVRFGSRVFFTGDDGLHGTEPYLIDGTPGGTSLLADINTEPLDSKPGGVYPVSTAFDQRGRINSATVGDTLFFTTADGSLYKSDGTAPGTVLIKNVTSDPRYMTAWNGSIYFVAATTSNAQVWRSDGTASGTVALMTGPNLNFSTLTTFFIPFQGALYFLYPGGLYKTDGTAQGTTMVASGFSNAQSLTAAGNHLFFITGTIRELWMSDGTSGGTSKLSAVVPAATGLAADSIYDFNGVLYFRGGSSSTNVHGLWKTDGTPAGTAELVPGIMVPTNNGPAYEGTYFVSFNGRLWFGATSSGAGWELWSSDGTAAGTAQVIDINPGSASSWPSWLTVANGRLFFAAITAAAGFELWSTDGTAAGTMLAADVRAGSGNGFTPYGSNWNEWPIFAVGSSAFFVADDGNTGSELWQSDGTPSTTLRVVDLYPGLTDSDPRPMGAIHPADDPAHLALIFSGDEPIHGRELWRTPSDNIPPVISQARFGWDVTTAPRVVTLQFNEALTNFSSNDVSIARGSDQQAMPFTFGYDATGNVAMVTLTGAPADDNYRVVIPAGHLRDVAGNVQSAALSFDFFVLTADGDRNRTVDIADFNLLATNFGKTGQTFSQGNYDYSADGSVNILDFNILATKFGTHLDAPAAPASLPASGFAVIEGSSNSISFQPYEANLLADSNLI